MIKASGTSLACRANTFATASNTRKASSGLLGASVFFGVMPSRSAISGTSVVTASPLAASATRNSSSELALA